MAGKRGRVSEDDAAAPSAEDTPEKRQRLDQAGSAAAAEKRSEASADQSAPAPATSTDGQLGTSAAVTPAPTGEAIAAVDANGSAAVDQPDQEDDVSSDDEPLMPSIGAGGGVKRGAECPYLDTVSRQVRQL